MNKLFFTFFILLISVILFSQVEKSAYYIDGDFKTILRNGKFVYQLNNIIYKGVTTSTGANIEGIETNEGFASFQFDNISTSFPNGFNNMKFYRRVGDTWQIDGETKDVTKNHDTSSTITLMLNLDCSSSIGNEDFSKLKTAAVDFIEQLFSNSSSGNITIGIIGFNSMKNTDAMVYPITKLNSKSLIEMKYFIMSLRINNNTSLYYAIRKSVQMCEEYLNQAVPDKFHGTFIITFTDGYDNNSMDVKLGVPGEGKSDPYFKRVRDVDLKKYLQGKKIESYIIAIPGDDVGSNKKIFESILEDLSDTLYLAQNYDKLNQKFKDLAKSLINRSTNLICYVPPRFSGKVRWTLDDGYVTQPKTYKYYYSSFRFGYGQYIKKESFRINDFQFALEHVVGITPTVFLNLGMTFNYGIGTNEEWVQQSFNKSIVFSNPGKGGIDLGGSMGLEFGLSDKFRMGFVSEALLIFPPENFEFFGNEDAYIQYDFVIPTINFGITTRYILKHADLIFEYKTPIYSEPIFGYYTTGTDSYGYYGKPELKNFRFGISFPFTSRFHSIKKKHKS